MTLLILLQIMKVLKQMTKIKWLNLAIRLKHNQQALNLLLFPTLKKVSYLQKRRRKNLHQPLLPQQRTRVLLRKPSMQLKLILQLIVNHLLLQKRRMVRSLAKKTCSRLKKPKTKYNTVMDSQRQTSRSLLPKLRQDLTQHPDNLKNQRMLKITSSMCLTSNKKLSIYLAPIE